MQDLSNLVVYNDGELELKVSVDSETIWLTQKQLIELFGEQSKILVYILTISLKKKN